MCYMIESINVETSTKTQAQNTYPPSTLAVTFSIEAYGDGRKIVDMENVRFEIPEFINEGGMGQALDVFYQCFDLLVSRPAKNAVARFARERANEEVRKFREQNPGFGDQVCTFADLDMCRNKAQAAAEEQKAKAA